MHLYNSVKPKKSSVAPYGARNPDATRPRAHARCSTLRPANAGSLSAVFLPALLLLLLIASAGNAQPARSISPSIVATSSLNREITDFLDKEMLAHLDDIKSYDPAPDKVFAAGATGEYTWGSFMNAVGAYAAMSGRRTLGRHNLAAEVGQI